MKSTNVNLNEKSCKTQNALIAEWLLAGNTITDKIARKEFDCSRISARIHNLKNDERWQWNIDTKIIKTDSGKHVAEYSMTEEERERIKNSRKEGKQ